MDRRSKKPIPIRDLETIGGTTASKTVATSALSTDRDVTDVDDADLGAFIKQTVKHDYTCVEYKAGSRIMLSVHGT
jgi:hypothetical protein